MSQPPQQPWDQPPPWGQQPPWGQHPPQQFAPGPPRSASGLPVLVLALVTALLGLLGTFLPSYSYGEDLGTYSPLLQVFQDDTLFLASGLWLLVAVALLVVGALVQRSRPGIGTGLVLVGAGTFAEQGGGLLFSLLQSVVDDRLSSDLGIGGVLLIGAAAVGVGTVVVGLVRLSRLR